MEDDLASPSSSRVQKRDWANVRKPPSAYTLFVIDRKGKMESMKGKDQGSAFKTMGKEWQDLDETQRERYREEAMKLAADWKTYHPEGVKMGTRQDPVFNPTGIQEFQRRFLEEFDALFRSTVQSML